MKQIFIYFLTFVLCGYLVHGQPTTVQTCNGASVSAYIYADISQAQKDQLRQDVINNYGPVYNFTAADVLEDPTPTFNCHAYAWHLREGNTNRVWINNVSVFLDPCYDNTHNIDAYWNDGCFVQVCNEADADKIHYYCGDHSAVRSTVVAGKYESKWGSWPVIRHFPTSVPYAQPTSVNYYASTRINGDASNLCGGTRTFSVKNISGATYNWSYSSNLSVSNPNPWEITVQQNGPNGAAWVQVQIITPCSAGSVRRLNFTVGTWPAGVTWASSNGSTYSGPLLSSYSFTGPPGNNGLVQFNITDLAFTNFVWTPISVPSGTSWGVFGPRNQQLNLSVTSPSTRWQSNSITVQCTASGPCGTFIQPFTATAVTTSGFAFAVSPNPARSDVQVRVNNASMKSNEQVRIYGIKITDLAGRVLKKQDFASGMLYSNIQLSGIKTGNYLISVFDGKQWNTQQLVIQK